MHDKSQILMPYM